MKWVAVIAVLFSVKTSFSFGMVSDGEDDVASRYVSSTNLQNEVRQDKIDDSGENNLEFSNVRCPLISSYKFGDKITNGALQCSSRHFRNGEWEDGVRIWDVPGRYSAFGITNATVSIRTTTDGSIILITLQDKKAIDLERENVRRELMGFFLRLQEAVVSEGGFSKKILGIESADYVDLKNESACDIQQQFEFSDATVRIAADFRRIGPYGANIMSREVHISSRMPCSAKERTNVPTRRKPFVLKKSEYAPLGSFEGLRFGQVLGTGKGKKHFVLTNETFNCKSMTVETSSLGRIKAIHFDCTGFVLPQNPFESLTQEFLRYQESVVKCYDYPQGLRGLDNIYYVESFRTKIGHKTFYISQSFPCRGGGVSVVLNASENKSNARIDWSVCVTVWSAAVRRDEGAD